MASIEVKMKNGTTKNFPHEGRAGGSYTKRVEYKGAFVVIRDEWDNETAIPVADVQEVKVSRERGGW